MTPEADLASRWLGGTVMAASDESFSDKENLLKPEEPVNDPGHFGNRGEIVDGWETKRRRQPGNDWALIRLGAAGVITSIDVDTRFFTGNFPQACRIEACGREGYPGPEELDKDDSCWIEIVPQTQLRGNSHNRFKISDSRRFTHLRLSTYPDGGIARLRVNGHILPDPRELDRITIDLAGRRYGGAVVASSDEFYTSAQLLNRPDEARSMGEGWEARRRRDSGHDFVLFRLAFGGHIRRVIVDTAHFRYNATPAIEVHGVDQEEQPALDVTGWRRLLGRTCLQPDTYHLFDVSAPSNARGGSGRAPDAVDPVSWIRLDAFPDGGISRVRVIGTIARQARTRLGYQWFNSLPEDQAIAVLTATGLSDGAGRAIAARRPLNDGEQIPQLQEILEGPPA